MELIKNLFKRTILIVVLISVLMTFLATPASYAKLELEDGEFYYAGTTEGAYVPTANIFSWLVNNIGDIADWILGLITMGFRMVFVGWTALLEKILTWALESTTGVAADGSLVSSSTDLSSLTDSSNNITVEAIVYNKVAAFNIDFFELEFDATTSGTGNKLFCKHCKKAVEECLPDTVTNPVKVAGEEYVAAEDEYNSYTSSLVGIGTGENELRKAAKEKVNQKAKARQDAIDNILKTSSCGCNGCENCEKYLNQLAAREPIIIKLRMLVATWYSIIRFLAMAAMLVILIAIGIKMAISTIASDKAVYKRMLVDWVVGVIILFMIHYFMIFCIHMNGVIIKVIEDSAQSINEVQMKQLFDDGDGKIANTELEVKVYEEVRTRAYDARLINGMLGMVMYMTLVFFAFKYTIIYLKRYLTILVLTLMGPAVGVAYALQKALSGRSSALSTWMKEYIMNVIIQIVHALLYAVFISQAMLLSLQSVAGILFAIVLMNYVSKADELFKKIFNFGGGDSLLGHTENAMQATMQGIQTAKGLATGAKPVMNMAKGEVKLAKAGVAAAVGLGAGAAAGAVAAVKDIAGTYRKNDSGKDRNPPPPSLDEGNEAENESGESLPTPKPMGKREQRKADDERLLDEGGTRLRQDVEAAAKKVNEIKVSKPSSTDSKAKKEYNKKLQIAKQQQAEAIQKYARFQQITNPSTFANLGGKFKRSIELENYFDTTEGVAPTLNSVTVKHAPMKGPKHVWESAVHGARVGSSFMNGRTTFNPKTFSFENSGTKGVLNMYKHFTPSNFFAFTEADKKQMKAITGTMGKALLGMGSVFLGWGMLVAEPKKGMALIAVGRSGWKKAFGKNLKVNGGNGRYSFVGFGSHSVNTIKNSALLRAKQEHAALVAQGIKTDYPSLAEKLKSGEASAITIGELGGELGPLFMTKNSPYSQVATAAMIERYGGRKTRFLKNRAIGAQMDDFARHYAKQQRKQMAEFIEEATEMEELAIEARIEYRKSRLENEVLTPEQKEEIEKVLEAEKKDLESIRDVLKNQNQEYDIDSEGDIVEVKKDSDKDNIDMIFAEILLEAEKDLKRYAGENDKDTSKTIAKKYDVGTEDLVLENGNKPISQKDIELINKEIDEILIKISQGKEVNLDSEIEQDRVIQLLSAKLAKKGLLANGQNAEVLFRKGRQGLKANLKKKAAKRNAALEVTSKKLEQAFSPEGATAIQELIKDIVKEKAESGKKEEQDVEITVMDVMERINRTEDGSLHIKAADGTKKASIRDGSSGVPNADGSPEVSNRDGSSRVSSRDGSSGVSNVDDSSNVPTGDGSAVVAGKLPLDSKEIEVLQQFMQVTRPTAPLAIKKVEKSKAKTLTNEAAKTARETKLQQAMLAMIEDIPESVETTEGTGTQTRNSTQDILAQLTKREADYVTSTVKDLLELKELNKETAELKRDKVKGPKTYVNAVKAESTSRIEVATLEREILIEQSRTDKPQAEIEITVDSLTKNLAEAKVKLQKQEDATAIIGPVVDITKFVQRGFRNDAVEELSIQGAADKIKKKTKAKPKKKRK